jgi:hypothetical protein
MRTAGCGSEVTVPCFAIADVRALVSDGPAQLRGRHTVIAVELREGAMGVRERAMRV